jgi:hypothetical protein
MVLAQRWVPYFLNFSGVVLDCPCPLEEEMVDVVAPVEPEPLLILLDRRAHLRWQADVEEVLDDQFQAWKSLFLCERGGHPAPSVGAASGRGGPGSLAPNNRIEGSRPASNLHHNGGVGVARSSEDETWVTQR